MLKCNLKNVNYNMNVKMLDKGKSEYLFMYLLGSCSLSPEIPQCLYQVSVSTKYGMVNFNEYLRS